MSGHSPEEIRASIKVYMMVFGALAAGTVITVLASYIDIPLGPAIALAFEDNRRRATEAGMDEFVTKPAKLAVLAAALERWCSVRRPSFRFCSRIKTRLAS